MDFQRAVWSIELSYIAVHPESNVVFVVDDELRPTGVEKALNGQAVDVDVVTGRRAETWVGLVDVGVVHFRFEKILQHIVEKVKGIALEIRFHSHERLGSSNSPPCGLSAHALLAGSNWRWPDLDARQKVEIGAVHGEVVVDLDVRHVVTVNALKVLVNAPIDLGEEVHSLLIEGERLFS
jgi:cold shock CspA family protein